MNMLKKQWYLAAAAVLFCVTASLAQTTTSITLTGTGDNSVVTNSSDGFGVYVDPYTATVGGVTGTAVICDDWSDNSYVPESWTAYVNSIASINNGTDSPKPLFGNHATLYDEAAWLASQLLANPTNPTLQAEVSFAIWELTYPYAPNPELPAPASFLAGSNAAGDQSAITALLGEAATAVGKGYNGAGWELLTPDTNGSITCGAGNCASTPPQEFLLYTPESSALLIFAADMLGLLGLAFLFRRRLLRPIP